MDYRVEKEVQDDGCRLLSMFDGDGEHVCHFCTEQKPIQTAFQATYDCVVYICKECSEKIG